jgi:hypothetical protein
MNNGFNMDRLLKKHREIYSHIPYSSFDTNKYNQFTQRLANSTSDLCEFLELENWDEDYIAIMIDITERYSLFFLTLSKEESEVDVNEFKQTQKLLCNFIVLFTLEFFSDEVNALRIKLLEAFFDFLKTQIKDSEINVLITMFNQLMTIVQEYIGLTVQFFLCIADAEKNKNFKKYMNDCQPFVYENCDYFHSEYFALMCKYFKDIGDICIITNRELIFKKIYEAIFGNEIDYTVRKVHLNLKEDFNIQIDFFLFCDVLKKIPELCSPVELEKSFLKVTDKEDIKKYLHND